MSSSARRSLCVNGSLPVLYPRLRAHQRFKCGSTSSRRILGGASAGLDPAALSGRPSPGRLICLHDCHRIAHLDGH